MKCQPPPALEFARLWCGTHTAEVQDEAVACVEAVPAHRDLRGPDCSPAFDLQQPLHSDLVGNHVPEARSHTTSLGGKHRSEDSHQDEGEECIPMGRTHPASTRNYPKLRIHFLC